MAYTKVRKWLNIRVFPSIAMLYTVNVLSIYE